MIKKIETKYKSELNKISGENFKEKWISLTQDITNDVESIWDYNSIRYDTVMNLKEWKEFVEHKERIPYKSKILPSRDTDKYYEKIVDIIKDSFELYKATQDKEFKDKLKSAINSMLSCYTNAKYDVEMMRFADSYTGRSNEDRDNGKVEPTEIGKNKFNYALKEYAYFNNKNFDELKEKYETKYNGRISTIFDYIQTCDVPLEERLEIKDILTIYSRDFTLDFFELKVGWEIWKVIREIGIDNNAYLELTGLPKYKTIEKRFLEFLSNEEFAKECLNHMKDELPDSYAIYKKNKVVKSTHLAYEESKRKKYPKKLRTSEEINKMVKECDDEILELFPLAKNPSPKHLILNPTHPAATSRAFQSRTKNINEDMVNVIVMTPRSDQKDDYLPTLAHEVTHAIHTIILHMGEKANVLEKGAPERVPSPVMEDFSQLVEHQFHRDTDLPYEKTYKGKEFPNFRNAIVIRFQAPYGLVQLGIREKFDEMWEAGFRGLLEEHTMWEIKLEFDKKVNSWIRSWINIDYGHVNSLRLFRPENFGDGTVYMKKYLVKSEQPKSISENSQKNKKLNMEEGFKARFGKEWVKSKDARTILLWLLLESGRNHSTETFGEKIKKLDIKKCLAELELIGVKSNI